MIVKYIGRVGIRTVGPYTWNEANNWTVDVTDPSILEDLQTYPKPGQWEFPEPADTPSEPVEAPETAVSTSKKSKKMRPIRPKNSQLTEAANGK